MIPFEETGLCNDPKFSDRYAWTNSADPDQIAPRGAVWSGSTLFAIPSAPFGHITLLRATLFKFGVITAIFWVSAILGFYGISGANVRQVSELSL